MILVNRPPTTTPSVAINTPGETVSAHLNMLRAAAALVVLVGHTRSGLFVPLPDIAHPGLVTRLVYDVSDFGPQAVMLFFVLSGFLITLSIAKAFRKGTWSWKSYLVARLSRLWIVLLPALLLGWFWDSLGIQLFGLSGTYGATNLFHDYTTGFTMLYERLTVVNALGNAFFVQGILVPTIGSNDALWSLSYEFWYYILFPLLLLVILPQTSLARRILCGLAAAGVLYFIGPKIALYFLIWLIGASLVILPPVQKWFDTAAKRRAGLIVAFGGIVVSLALNRIRLTAGFIVPLDFALGFFVAVLIYVLLHSQPTQPQPSRLPAFYLKTSRSLANFSYTLYLVHLPLLTFIREVVVPRDLWQLTPANLLVAGLIDLVIIAYAFGISRLTEAHTDRVRNYIMRKI